MIRSSLVLVAHGSTESANAPIRALAAQIANRLGLDTRAAFLNGQPQVIDVLETLPPGSATVVPIMTSHGYYFEKLPDLLKRNRNFDRFEISLTPAVGTHPRLPVAMYHRIEGCFQRFELSPDSTSVVVIGHGTARNANSCRATLELVKQLRILNEYRGLEFEPAFLDQQPALVDVAQLLRPNVIALPFLISPGPHLLEDVPRALGINSGPFPITDRKRMTADGSGLCYCEGPLVQYPEIAEIILDQTAGVTP